MKAEDDPTLHRPDEEELEKNTEKTRLALEKLTHSKIAAAMPVRCADKVVSTRSTAEVKTCFDSIYYAQSS